MYGLHTKAIMRLEQRNEDARLRGCVERLLARSNEIRAKRVVFEVILK